MGLLFYKVRKKGLEPPRREAPDPKSGAATNYATSAFRILFSKTICGYFGLQRYNLAFVLQTVWLNNFDFNCLKFTFHINAFTLL